MVVEKICECGGDSFGGCWGLYLQEKLEWPSQNDDFQLRNLLFFKHEKKRMVLL